VEQLEPKVNDLINFSCELQKRFERSLQSLEKMVNDNEGKVSQFKSSFEDGVRQEVIKLDNQKK
jgi:hypothetical protein